MRSESGFYYKISIPAIGVKIRRLRGLYLNWKYGYSGCEGVDPLMNPLFQSATCNFPRRAG
jgi:hypothetical protein